MVGRSLTARVVLVVAGSTAVAACLVSVSLAFLCYSIISRAGLTEAIPFSDVAASAFLFAMVAIGFATLLGWRLGLKVTRPVLDMSRAMEAMAEGNLTARTRRAANPTVEERRMADAFEQFRRTAHDLIHSEAGRQAAEKAASDRSEFLAVMSHELRTPMNGVLGMAEALSMSGLDARQREMLSVLTGSGDILMRLLNDVLDFSKIQSDRLELETAPFDVASTLSAVVELFRPEGEAKGLEISLTAPEGCWLNGDAARIRQITTNLLSNAVKFTPKGQVRVEADVTFAAEKGLLQISVVDTGIGIPVDVQPRLFQKFVQADASSTRAYGGTGLGLAISRDLARMMGGDIEMMSRPGEGSSFTVSLGLPLAEQPSTPATTSAPPAMTTASTRLRVLAAEDNASNRDVLRIILDIAEVDVTFAWDGGEVVELYKNGRYDLVLMDIQMPVADGLEATRSIRAWEAKQSFRTPIIAVSANCYERDVRACLEAGMDGHVAKPLRVDALMEQMDKVCAPRAPEQAEPPSRVVVFPARRA